LRLIDKNFMADEGYGRIWFKGFFDGFMDREDQFLKEKNTEPRESWHYLTALFKEKKLSIKKMNRLVELHPVVVPRIDLE